MATPGIGDPYWYEWFVGLNYVIDMLNPENEIECVVFQHETYNTIDDVVVEYKDQKKLCYQVKHEVSTSEQKNFTFGKLLEKNPRNNRSLIKALFLGWQEANKDSKNIFPILFTNRTILNRKSSRTYMDKKYTAYSVIAFFEKLKEHFNSTCDIPAEKDDENLFLQWNEFYDSIGKPDINDAIEFVKCIDIKGNQSNLTELTNSLINKICKQFSCNEDLATNLFSKLLNGLSKWVVSTREDQRVVVENVLSELCINDDIHEEQHRLSYPFPFFESRKEFTQELKNKIYNSQKKVLFITGAPGSGKTSTISYLQADANIFMLRYHTFRPISPEQHFYNVDEGLYSSENLWGTFLVQLRKKLIGRLYELNVPIYNALLNTESMRNNVLRILGILSKEKPIFVCIDGIDHAARATDKVTFLSSLPMPDEIPDAVRFVIVGQPIDLYEKQYPSWLCSAEHVEHISLPKLEKNDLCLLVENKLPQFKEVARELSNLIHSYTDGNNLSSVFAVENLNSCSSLDDADRILKLNNISTDIEQYYNHIWNYTISEIGQMGLNFPFPEGVIACSILLMNGRVSTKILASALSYAISESDWKTIFNKLYPLVIKYNDDEYSLFHNDFRIYLMKIIHKYEAKYKEIAFDIAKYLLENDIGIISYVLGIPLLCCAQKNELIPKYFNAEFVLNALSEGVSKNRINDYFKLAYSIACDNKDMEGYINTYFALNTLYQHNKYFEYYARDYKNTDHPELAEIDICEIRNLPLNKENLHEYETVLEICLKLFLNQTHEYKERALSLYNKWYQNLSPKSFLEVAKETDEDFDWGYLRNSIIGSILKKWANICVKFNVPLPVLKCDNSSEEEKKLLNIFSVEYFNLCISLKQFELAEKNFSKLNLYLYDFGEKIEDIYYNNSANLFSQHLKYFITQENEEKFLLLAAVSLCSIDSNFVFDEIDSYYKDKKEIKIYDDSSFSLVMLSYIYGHNNKHSDDDCLVNFTDELYQKVSLKNKLELEQMKKLLKFSCLLGKYNTGIDCKDCDILISLIHWFMRCNFYRRFDYSSAIKFLIYSLMQSPTMDYLISTEDFLTSIKYHLNCINHIGMYYKTYILETLKNYNKYNIIKEYIINLYGENNEKINQYENKTEIHSHFAKYAELVLPHSVSAADNQLKWDIVGYIGNDEYSLEPALHYFNRITAITPEKWNEYAYDLYRISEIMNKTNNRLEFESLKSIIKSATRSGQNGFRDVITWTNEFRMNSDLLHEALLELIKNSSDPEDVKIIWFFNLGINSWYTFEEISRCIDIYNACIKKTELFDFKEFVKSVTPQWNVIIENNINCNKSLDNTKIIRDEQFYEVKKYYSSIDIDKLIAELPNTATLSRCNEVLEIIFHRLKNSGSLSIPIAKQILDILANFLVDKVYIQYNIESLLCSLVAVLGDEVIWKLAEYHGDFNDEYWHYIVLYNMQYLIKVYGNIYSKNEELLRREVALQDLWTSGDNHIKIVSPIPKIPKNDSNIELLETLLNILFEHLSTQNARKVEAANFAIYNLGINFQDTITIISKHITSLSEFQKECIYLIAYRWIKEKIGLEMLREVFLVEYEKCTHITNKYILHSLLLALNIPNISKNLIICSAQNNPTENLEMRLYATTKKFEKFCSALKIPIPYTEQTMNSNAREMDPHQTACDCIFPVSDEKLEDHFYKMEQNGELKNVDIRTKKIFLLPIEDPFLITDMPKIIYNDILFPVSQQYDHKACESQFNLKNYADLSRILINHDEMLLASCIWYPECHNEGAIYYEYIKIAELKKINDNQTYNCCLGNYGILSDVYGLFESKNFYNGEFNLFCKLFGSFNIIYNSPQIVPSSLFRKLFDCCCDINNPYILQNRDGKLVAKFERIMSPRRNGMRQVYIRQPIIFRWICDKQWFEKQLKTLNLQSWYAYSTEPYPKFDE